MPPLRVNVALQPCIEHLFDGDPGSIVVAMRTSSAALPATVTPSARRPHLLLVPTPLPRPPVPARRRLAALLAGLISGFVLAALAAVLGGGSPTGALGVATGLGVVLAAVLVRCRVVARRTRRRGAATRARATAGPTRIARAA
jgi:hypothetical protein